jgi:YD repeat-containing protein
VGFSKLDIRSTSRTIRGVRGNVTNAAIWHVRLSYVYDADSRRTVMIAPGVGRGTYGYDAQNRVTMIYNAYDERTTLTWDPLGRESVRRLGNQVAISHVYDAAGRETGLHV